ncbi:MAG: hypothetical protein OXG26_18665 [Caldilineaceae bacterium]|nr:hypothetical protein [Caldilineaceae bacterium]MDE0634179.1 hypothetical protein [Caldilineaceae bacterium]
MSDNSLWGDLSDLAPERTPFLVLQEQANYLQGATNEILAGRVRREMTGIAREGGARRVHASLQVVAPALQHYYVELLQLSYDASVLYPVHVRDSFSGEALDVFSEDELRELLRGILTSDAVRTILANLISESQFSQKA